MQLTRPYTRLYAGEQSSSLHSPFVKYLVCHLGCMCEHVLDMPLFVVGEPLALYRLSATQGALCAGRK